MLAALLAAWQILASFLWIAPNSDNAREAIPGDALTKYMLPFFGQSWSVFAPEPINGDYHFDVRAVIPGGSDNGTTGKDRVTGWVSATNVELSMIRYNLAPPRAGIQSSEVASRYKDAFNALTKTQRMAVRENFVDKGWEHRLSRTLKAQPGSETPKVSTLGAEEHMSTAYATQVARAIWGDDVVRVQYRVIRQNVVPFAKRNDPNAQRPTPEIVRPGWRAPVVEPGQDDDDFRKTFAAQYKKMHK